jgi:hypothetical protein
MTAREFGKGRRVYDGYRRYFGLQDPARKKKDKVHMFPSKTDEYSGLALQFSFNEEKSIPVRR